MSERSQLIALYSATCAHFDGIRSGKKCGAGVDYMSVRDISRPGMARWPCHTLDGKRATTTCAGLRLNTPAEAEAIADTLLGAFEKAEKAIADGRCHHCGGPAEPHRIVGACAYGPCGYRLGQVDSGEQ